MLSPILTYVLPLPSALILLFLTLYHLTPLLSLFSNLTPTLQKLSTIIPHPRRQRNLPREFFNLPPRPGSPSSLPSLASRIGDRLGVRGKVMLIFLIEGLVSLLLGWVALANGKGLNGGNNWGLVAGSVVIIPSTITCLALFTTVTTSRSRSETTSKWKKIIFKSSGITHSTLTSRILPLSTTTSILTIILTSAVGKKGRYVVLGYTTLCVVILGACTGIGMWRMVFGKREGKIRLKEGSRYEKTREGSGSPTEGHVEEAVQGGDGEVLRRVRSGSSWVSSPSSRPTLVSSFTYTPTTADTSGDTSASFQTPKSKPSSARTSTTNLTTPEATPSALHDLNNDQSWLSEPTNTPSTISAWSFPSTPETAITRDRTRSPSPSPVSLPVMERHHDPNLPQPGQTRVQQLIKSSDTTAYTRTLTSTPGSAIRSPGGSIIAGYSPDPSHPLPRGFESLTSYPLSPSQMESRTSLGLGSRVGLRSVDELTCVPVERVSAKGSSTWTLQSYHSPSASASASTGLNDPSAYKTPESKSKSRSHLTLVGTGDRRPPPPLPMPMAMPLPPTPTFARSSTLWELSSDGGDDNKGSMEMLMAERDWVEVGLEEGEEGLEGWGRDGKGVGVVAVLTTLVCYGLSLPLLLEGPTDTATILYLISLLIPSPMLVLVSYLLRYRLPRSTGSTIRTKKGSTTTTHRSLALRSESQLSLPISISPKLTPPAPKRASTMNLASSTTQLSKLIEPKPSLTTFQGTFAVRSPERRHTVYGGGLDFKDLEAEERMRRIVARRSGDVWIEAGHAIEGGGMLSRVGEMIKPVPAMRVLDAPLPGAGEAEVGSRELGIMRKLRGGVVSMLPKRASRLFESDIQPASQPQAPPQAHTQGQDALEMGQFDDARTDAESTMRSAAWSPARSTIAISVIGPSPEKRRTSRFSTITDGGGEADNSLPTAKIYEAKRGRMSSGPMLIFKNPSAGDRKEKEKEGGGYELDWLTAGVLPNLVPSIKIGKDVRVEPIPRPISQPEEFESQGEETPKFRTRELSTIPSSREIEQEDDCRFADPESSFATMPSFYADGEFHSTPHDSKRGTTGGHSRSYSSSIDYSRSPEFYTAETTCSGELRQRGVTATATASTAENGRRVAKPKKSFGLPQVPTEEDFEHDVRKSFDEISRPGHDEQDNRECEEDDVDMTTETGVDLPPIPTRLTHNPSLSRVSEVTEENTTMQFSISLLEDMHLALQLGQTPPRATNDHQTSFPSSNVNLDVDYRTVLAPGGDESRHRSQIERGGSDASTATGEYSFAGQSINTEAEEIVEEMERMMSMDTPTRAEFVISPPPSSSTYDGPGSASGRTSRASAFASEGEREATTPTSTSFTGSTWTTSTATSTSTDNDNYASSSSSTLPVPELPSPYKRQPYPTTAPSGAPISHPHPPPRSFTNSSGTTTNFPLPIPVYDPHPPVQRLLPKRSTETIATTSSTSAPNTPKTITARPSRVQLKQDKQLTERNGARAKSAMGLREKGKPLQPIRVNEANNTRSIKVSDGPLSAPIVGGKKFVVLQQDELGSKTSLTKGMGKMSTGSAGAGAGGKENEKIRGSKTSTGSGVVGVRGLRA
ncbi:hypothetical protein CI109_106411 [Kwoniella shandongensis]|uniref:Uncharacterized protein n=1 Tax=Kwoniella shandongensis TaxID=1734106 RepID=A0A5M6C127_9TREE|nr:uncharacterized protein CI109_002594 [Kwoniella shandongensis]KAA5528837.1 hypothetical protein CI109_002594 [Kwoniella shandongensis]